MPTVQEVFKQAGFTDEQIAALDAKAVSAFSTVLTTAEEKEKTAAQKAAEAAAAAAKAEADAKAAQAALDKTELERRSLNEFYETKVLTGLTGWEEEQKLLQTEKANAEALAAFYKAQNEAARTAGFVPKDAPTFTPSAPAPDPARDASGRFVANVPGSTPGSPTFIDPNKIVTGVQDAFKTISDIEWEYKQLYGGQPMPIAPSQLIAQADSLKLSPAEYAARTFKFSEKRQEIAQAQAKAHDDAIRAESDAKAKADYEAKEKALRDELAAEKKKLMEGRGNNPDVRTPAGSSQFAEVQRAVKEGTRPDPLKMTDADRRRATRNQIHSEIAEREVAGAVA